jgi:Flp pilus assembly protein TadG
MVLFFGMLALSIDLGYVASTQSELQRATDAAALAGAGVLADGATGAQSKAFEFLARNPIAQSILYEEENWEEKAQAWLAAHPDDFKLQVGQWDPSLDPGTDPTKDNRFFQDADSPPSAIWVTAQRTGNPLFFAGVLGQQSFTVSAQSIARYLPRDIVLVLDFSGSMSYDSQVRRVTYFGE